MDAEYTLKAQKHDQGQQLTLSGNLTLNNLSNIKQDLLPYIGKKGGVRIVLDEVEAFDLGIFQLLQAFIWAQKTHGVTTSVDMHLNAEQQKLVNDSGIQIKSE
ncbi:MAG: STAS domain-containing protein [Bacteroidales bacterium]|nr:STAS domain-containing protein [Bacteroidales bacterium]